MRTLDGISKAIVVVLLVIVSALDLYIQIWLFVSGKPGWGIAYFFLGWPFTLTVGYWLALIVASPFIAISLRAAKTERQRSDQQCPDCGRQVFGTHKLCEQCDSHAAEQATVADPGESHFAQNVDRRGPSSEASFRQLSPALTLLAFTSLMGAFFLPYSGATSGKSLFETPGDIGYNAGLIIVVGAALISSLGSRTRETSVALSLVALLWWLPGVIGNVLRVSQHQDSFNVGSYLAILGTFVLGANFLTANTHGWIRWKVSKSSLIVSVLAGLLGVLWGVGEWMPWNRTIYTAGVSGVKFSSGTGVLQQDCCTLFSNAGNSGYNNLDSAIYLLEIIMLIIGAITVCHFASRITAGVGLGALAIGFSGEIVSGLQTAANSNPALSTVYSGTALTQAVAEKIVITASPLLGMWLNLAAEVGLLLLGIYFCITSQLVNDHLTSSLV